MDQEAQAIVEALDMILNEITRREPPERRKWPNERALDPTSVLARDICNDPIGRSLRLGITALGERLHDKGGMPLMHEVLEAVVALDDANANQRTNILDKRWDGVGHWMA